MKVECLIKKCNEAFVAVVDKSKILVAFAGVLLEAMTTKNDKILTSARNYNNSVDDKVSEFQEPRASIRSRVSSQMALSKTSSQRKHDYVIAKIKRDENDKENEAAILLAKQKKQVGGIK